MRMNEKELTVMRQQPALFVPLGEYSKPGVVSGFILTDNTKIIEMRGVSGLVFSLYRKQLSAKPFTVKGTWTFVPDEDTLLESFDLG